MAMKKKYLCISIGLVLVMVGLQLTGTKKKVRVKKTRAPLVIDITELSLHDYDVAKDYIGTLYPAHKFELHSLVGGRLLTIDYDIGDWVKNDSTIAQLDDTLYQLEFQQAQGKLSIEQSKVRQKQMSIDLAEKEYNRMLALREEKVVSESALEKAKYDFEQQKMTFDVDKANLAMQETAVDVSQLKWSYTDIKARWARDEDNGSRLLAERFVDQGAMITPNTVLATIIDVGVLKAEIFVGEKEYPLFKAGMKVTLDVDSFPGVMFVGSVARVAPFINEQTRQAKVQILIENEDLRLRPGMFARTRVILNTRTSVPMIPKTCVLERDGQQGVFLYNADEKTVSFQPVELGVIRQGDAEILNQDAINRPVVMVGQHMVRDGFEVNLIGSDSVVVQQDAAQ